jgi:hypothetical protein
MPAKRSLSFVGVLLLLALIVPLLAATATVALGAGCPDCPPSTTRHGHGADFPDSDTGPCAGDPLLICCDQQMAPARAPSAIELRSGFLQWLGAPADARLPIAESVSSQCADARDAVWWASPRALSVVLRL